MTKNSINNSSSDLQVSAINIAGSTISTTTTNTNLSLTPNGTGKVSVSGAYTLPNTDGTSGQYLRTSGAGSLSFATISNGLSTSINVQTFTASGTYTPTAGMVECIAECIGGGGGSGGAIATGVGTTSNGAGGGGGGYARRRLTAAQIGVSKAVTIGAGGTAGTASPIVNGGNAGTTSLGALLSASGGTGGFTLVLAAITATSQAGDPGIGASGDVNITGTPGRDGVGLFIGLSLIPYLSIGGSGGSSYYGPPIVNSGSTTDVPTGPGFVGKNYGGGATGAYNGISQAGRNGAAGAPGIVIITEYIV